MGSLGSPHSLNLFGLMIVLRQKFVQDLEALFDVALQKGDLAAALKAKELLGKEQGFFLHAKERSPASRTLDLENLSDAELEHLVQQIEQRIEQVETPSAELPADNTIPINK